jgi:hypothetical protein
MEQNDEGISVIPATTGRVDSILLAAVVKTALRSAGECFACHAAPLLGFRASQCFFGVDALRAKIAASEVSIFKLIDCVLASKCPYHLGGLSMDSRFYSIPVFDQGEEVSTIKGKRHAAKKSSAGSQCSGFGLRRICRGNSRSGGGCDE